MKPLSSEQIRNCFVNATPADLDRMALPGLHEVIWAEREFLGWRDPHRPQRGYLVHWVNDRPVGILVSASDGRIRPGISAMCALCQTTRSADKVTLFAAPKAGEAGQNGNTVGTYICDDLACSYLIRMPRPTSSMQLGEVNLDRRILGLSTRVKALTETVMKAA